jgi:hypothetical protein
MGEDLDADNVTDALLRKSLLLAVPIWIEELKDKPEKYLSKRAGICSAQVSAHGDILLYGGGKRVGGAAEIFNRLAEGIALLFLITRHDLPSDIFGQQECPAFLKHEAKTA